MLTTIRSLVDKFFGENEEQHTLVSQSEEMKSIEAELEKIQTSTLEKTPPEVVEQHFSDLIHKGYIPALNTDVTDAVKTLLEYHPNALMVVLESLQPSSKLASPQESTSLPSHLSLRSAAEQSFLSSL